MFIPIHQTILLPPQNVFQLSDQTEYQFVLFPQKISLGD